MVLWLLGGSVAVVITWIVTMVKRDRKRGRKGWGKKGRREGYSKHDE